MFKVVIKSVSHFPPYNLSHNHTVDIESNVDWTIKLTLAEN